MKNAKNQIFKFEFLQNKKNEERNQQRKEKLSIIQKLLMNLHEF